jgi:hypothetical protein
MWINSWVLLSPTRDEAEGLVFGNGSVVEVLNVRGDVGDKPGGEIALIEGCEKL